MKRRILDLFKSPRMSKKDLWITVILALLWLGSIELRPVVINTRCSATPTPCTAESVNRIDRFALGKDSSPAEDYSTNTQYFTGAWAYLVPLGLHVTKAVVAGNPITGALVLAVEDALLITQTLVANGSLNEVVRLIAQRPRPYVYKDPLYYGANPANYTSFYSGHTSYSAAINTALLFVMLGRSAPLWLILITGIGGQAIVISTAITRILAGRHFFTDVTFAILAGVLVATFVALSHRDDNSA